MSKSALAGQALGATTINELDETVTGAAKSSFAIEYSPSFPTIVVVNGIVLSTNDYDQSNGTTIEVTVPLEVDEHIHITAFKVVGLYGSDTVAESDAKFALKLDKDGDVATDLEYTGAKETQHLTLIVSGSGQTKQVNYSYGQTQRIWITTDDAFTINFGIDWPTTEAGFMTLIVEVATGVTVGSVTWPTTKNTPPDFSAITPDTGEGIYTIFYGNGAYRVYVVEES